jgi:hypothetical protein
MPPPRLELRNCNLQESLTSLFPVPTASAMFSLLNLYYEIYIKRYTYRFFKLPDERRFCPSNLVVEPTIVLHEQKLITSMHEKKI